MATPQLAGEVILAEDIQVPGFIRKPTATALTSNTTLTADPDLTVFLPVGDWRIDVYLTVTGAAAADIKVNYAWTGTATISRQGFGPGPASTDVNDAETGVFQGIAFSSSLIYGTSTAGSRASGIHENLLVEVTVAGTLTLQWAQNASSATATNVTGSSKMFVTQVTDA